MSKSISILDQDYILWIKDLSSRYRRSQIKAAVKVNQEMLQFYWDLGKDIVERDVENRYGARFYASLSRDLKTLLLMQLAFQSEICIIRRSSTTYIDKCMTICSKLLQILMTRFRSNLLQNCSQCLGGIICC